MYIINRKGKQEPVIVERILNRIKSLSYGLSDLIDASRITNAVYAGMFSGISSTELDELSAQECASMIGIHPDYSILAARIAASNLFKNVVKKFSQSIELLYDSKGLTTKKGIIADHIYKYVMENAEVLDNAIVKERDFDFSYFGFKTMEKSYLLRSGKKIVETPQYMFMRVAVQIHIGDLDKVIETYNLLSQKYFIHATPTLFNAATRFPQMSSCYLLQMQSDSIDGIYNTLKQCAIISKYAGGVGLAIHKIRAHGTEIQGTNGISNGVIPMLKVFNETARYVDQGGGRRKGGFAVYLEPWHSDIFEFLELKKNHGNEEARARDLFYALWIPDLFMKRVDQDSHWSLMCPHQSPGLHEVWGKNFEKLYESYEKEGRYIKQIKARELWMAILVTQMETGNPYMVFKDAANRKSNQQNLGTIQSSNLCTEVIQYTSPDEIAICNLASISLPKYVNQKEFTFDYKSLYEITKVVTVNLNKVVDTNFYHLEEGKRSNMLHRPIGIGVQGLADVYQLLELPFDTKDADIINQRIFETIYFAALTASCELAEKFGTYPSYEDSPMSKGLLQFDLWNLERAEKNLPPVQLSGLWDWDELRAKIKKFGIHNSLLVAPMPTASTSQILGNCESFEPYISNIFSRRVLSGEFQVVNPHLCKKLVQLNLWNEEMKQKLIAHEGSIQAIDEIPSYVKAIFKTTWEIKQKEYINQSISRAPFICQSQSLSLYLRNPTYSNMTSMHFYAWRNGLKTGLYYLRTKSAADAIKFTIDPLTVRVASSTSISGSAENSENNSPRIVSACPLKKPDARDDES
ncbi:ribonucleoside-diphosphate reductase large subunit-like [Dermatophagoides farinae]|uniref:ribonucleoside-diphosphate reductase large subunit-like n=1 Tax=Dermatophagoides farinae TaxID=6954 RepID=UPI003F6001F6